MMIKITELLTKVKFALNCADADLQGIEQRWVLGTDASDTDVRAAGLTRIQIERVLEEIERLLSKE